jgi:hypothetical protein
VALINSVTLSTEEDKWRWRPDANGEFSVKYTYEFVSEMLVGQRIIDDQQAAAFKAIWKFPVPSKVSGLNHV